MRKAEKTTLTSLYDLVTGDEDARLCRDIPEDACRELPGNFFKHLISSTATKIGDSLASAKLVIPWLLAAIGAPAFLTGLVVPIREAGSLIPQLFVAGFIRPYAYRKWFWVWGSVLEGAAVIAIAAVALTLSGTAGGWITIALLVVFSLSRGVVSVASKDVLGKTVSKNRRGTLMGYAGAVAGLATMFVGLYTKARGSQTGQEGFFFGLLLAAGILWFLAAFVFSTIKETPGATGGGGNAISKALSSLSLLKTDSEFRHFVITRTLLLSTALSFPFYAVMSRENLGAGLGGFGLLIIAGGLGDTLSAPIWGRLADKSSRLVMVWAALITAGLGAVLFAVTFIEIADSVREYMFALFFLIMGIAHGGARLGRKTYLIDMATPETRPAYVAVSNTVIGILLLAGGGVGAVAQLFGTRYAILLLACVALIAATSALRLREVQ